MIQLSTFAESYRELLEWTIKDPDFIVKPRGLDCNELTSGMVDVLPYDIMFKNEARDVDVVIRYLVGEVMWYFGGRKDLGFIEKFAKFWKGIANEDGTCNSAYGDLVFGQRDTLWGSDNHMSQWTWAYNSLVEDRDTRQAVMHFNRPFHQYKDVKDFVCTMYTNFHIRKNKLYIISRMRSQDEVKGLTYDIVWFSLMLQNMQLLLKETYSELECGGVLHSSDSMHLYRKDFGLVEKMLENEFENVKIVLPHPLVNSAGNTTPFYDELIDMENTEWDDEKNKYRKMFEFIGGRL